MRSRIELVKAEQTVTTNMKPEVSAQFDTTQLMLGLKEQQLHV